MREVTFDCTVFNSVVARFIAPKLRDRLENPQAR
jgi:hypothetical protein